MHGYRRILAIIRARYSQVHQGRPQDGSVSTFYAGQSASGDGDESNLGVSESASSGSARLRIFGDVCTETIRKLRDQILHAQLVEPLFRDASLPIMRSRYLTTYRSSGVGIVPKINGLEYGLSKAGSLMKAPQRGFQGFHHVPAAGYLVLGFFPVRSIGNGLDLR